MMPLLPEWEDARQSVDAAVRTLLGRPETTSDHCLVEADRCEAQARESREPEARAILTHAADRLRRIAPIYAGRALRPGMPAGLGGE